MADVKSSKTRKWSNILVLIQHTTDHVRHYIHTVILSQRWYCELRKESETSHWIKEENMMDEWWSVWLGGLVYENYQVAPWLSELCNMNWFELSNCNCGKKRGIFLQALPTWGPMLFNHSNFYCYARMHFKHRMVWRDCMRLAFVSHWIHLYMCICVCVGESDLVGLHPAGGLLYEIKLDEGESSALTWTPPSAMATEQQQQHNNNNAVRG